MARYRLLNQINAKGGNTSSSAVTISVTANMNDAEIAGRYVTLVNNTEGVLTITGMTAGDAGEVKTLMNYGNATILLAGENASSLAANRFATGVNIAPGGSVTLCYNDQRWRMYG